MQDVTDLEAWIGKQEERNETIDQAKCELLAATLNESAPLKGEALPMPWHWAWFNDAKPADQLGRDGHPKKGGFVPPVPLPRRMWAGGQLEILKPVIVGHQITRRSTIENVQPKTGRSGALCIVTIRHELLDDCQICLSEIQNLVYREDPDAGSAPPGLVKPPAGATHEKRFTPDSVLMFRYSALTFNGHRIHYDVDYARDVEGYRGLVFHAPLTATLLFRFAEELAGGSVRKFDYRATTPLFCNEEITLCGKVEGNKITVWALNTQASQAMIAEAQF